MDKFKLKSQFNGSTTKAKFQLDHVWANILGNECKYGLTKGPKHVYPKSNFHK